MAMTSFKNVHPNWKDASLDSDTGYMTAVEDRVPRFDTGVSLDHLDYWVVEFPRYMVYEVK
jgi:hypothetical protein